MVAKMKAVDAYSMPAAGMPAHPRIPSNFGASSNNHAPLNKTMGVKYEQDFEKIIPSDYNASIKNFPRTHENQQNMHQSARPNNQTTLRPVYSNYRVALPGEAPVRHIKLDDWDENHRRQAPSQKPGFCVDELCSCGMHKCIPSRKPVPFEGDSIYRQEYGPKPLPPPAPIGEVKLPPTLPFDADSSYRQEYGPKPLPPPQKLGEIKLPPSLPFEGESNYRTEFGPKPLPKQELPSPVKLPPTLPFEAESSYRTEYGPKPLPPQQSPGEIKLPPTLPFDADSSYRQDYGPKPLPIPPKMGEVRIPPTLPFEGSSLYRTDYVRKEQPTCQVTKLPPYPQPCYPSNHVFWDHETKQWY